MQTKYNSKNLSGIVHQALGKSPKDILHFRGYRLLKENEAMLVPPLKWWIFLYQQYLFIFHLTSRCILSTSSPSLLIAWKIMIWTPNFAKSLTFLGENWIVCAFLCGAWWRTHRVWELLYDLSTKALHVELGVGVLELNLTNVIMAIKLQLITLYENFKSVNVSGTLIVTSNLSILILLLSLSLRTRVVFITTVRITCQNCCLFELTLKICLNPRQICVNRSFAVLCLEDTHHIDMVPEW